jgi:hypothetical protein
VLRVLPDAPPCDRGDDPGDERRLDEGP